jgi:cytochrome c oxidase subunit IV
MAHYGEKFVDPPVIEADPAKISKIWKTAGILAIITAIEFIFAFTWGEKDATLITIYIVLTLFKAYFIMAEFMHLGHEKKSLQLSILLPLIFIAWGVVAMLQEANTIHNMIETWYSFLK